MARLNEDSLARLSVLEDALLGPRGAPCGDELPDASDELPAQTRLVKIDAPPDAVLKVIELDAIDRLRGWQHSEEPRPQRAPKRRMTDPSDRRRQERGRPEKVVPLDLVKAASHQQRRFSRGDGAAAISSGYDSAVDGVLSAALALGATGCSELQSFRRTGSTKATDSSPRGDQPDTNLTPKAKSKESAPRHTPRRRSKGLCSAQLRRHAELAEWSFSRKLPEYELPGSGRRGSWVPNLPALADASPPNTEKLRRDRRTRSEVPRSEVERLPPLTPTRRAIDRAG